MIPGGPLFRYPSQPFVYSYYSWPCYRIDESRAKELVKEGKLGFRESARWPVFLENKEDYLENKKQVTQKP